MPKLSILADPTTRQPMLSLFSNQVAALPSPIFGEAWDLEISILEPFSGSGSRVWGTQALGEDDVIRIAAGIASGLPATGGTQLFTFGANTTAQLAYNVSAVDLATALNLLASIIAAGGVTVSGSGGFFTVAFNNVGARADFAVETGKLAPLSAVLIKKVVVGDVDTREVTSIRIQQAPVTQVELVESLPDANVVVVVNQVGGGGSNHKVTISLNPLPFGGSFKIAVGANQTAYLAHDITTADLLAAIVGLASVGASNASISQLSTFSWEVTFIAGKANTNMGTIAGDSSALLVMKGRKGKLQFDTVGCELVLLNTPSVTVSLEADLLPDGELPNKILRQDIQLLESVIDTTEDISPTPLLARYILKDNTNNNEVLVRNRRYVADTTVAAFALKLPLVPVVGDQIVVSDAQFTWATNNLTLDRNGQLINGAAGNLICNVSEELTLVFAGGARGWNVYT